MQQSPAALSWWESRSSGPPAPHSPGPRRAPSTAAFAAPSKTATSSGPYARSPSSAPAAPSPRAPGPGAGKDEGCAQKAGCSTAAAARMARPDAAAAMADSGAATAAAQPVTAAGKPPAGAGDAAYNGGSAAEHKIRGAQALSRPSLLQLFSGLGDRAAPAGSGAAGGPPRGGPPKLAKRSLPSMPSGPAGACSAAAALLPTIRFVLAC